MLNGSGGVFGDQEKLLRSGQTHEFDLSLLALLLLHVGTPSTTTKKHLHEIRSARNGTSHLANDRLDDKTFENLCHAAHGRCMPASSKHRHLL